MVRTAIDTDERSGNCSVSLEAGLGTPVDLKSTEGGGCAFYPAGRIGPNRLGVFWASLKSNAGTAGEPGPYRFHAITSAGRPTEANLRAAVERYHPDVLREGLPRGKVVWFIADRDHRVLHTGRATFYANSDAAKRDLEALHPGVEIRGMLMGSVPVETGDRIDLVWATLAAEPGAGAPPLPRAQ
jgi:hypothetical protein